MSSEHNGQSKAILLITYGLLLIGIVASASEYMRMPDVHKVLLTQRNYIQFLKYDVDVPPLNQFTFCLWLKSYNLTSAHTLFSYSLRERERVVNLWVSSGGNWIRASMFGREIGSARFDRPESTWRHVCLSWNSQTADWRIYLDGVIEAKGIDEHLKGTVFPGGGDIVIGQDYTDINKGLGNGIEGEVFGFNMVLASTVGESRLFEPTILPNYVILEDIASDSSSGQVVTDTIGPKQIKSFRNQNYKYIKTNNDNIKLTDDKNVDFDSHKYDGSGTKESTMERGVLYGLSDFEVPPPLDQSSFQVYPADNEIKMDFKPPMPVTLVNSEHIIKVGDLLVSEPNSMDSLEPAQTYEVLYSKANFKGNKWLNNDNDPAPFWNVVNEAGNRGNFKMGKEINYQPTYLAKNAKKHTGISEFETPPPPGRNNFYSSSGKTGLENALGLEIMLPPKPLYLYSSKPKGGLISDLFPYASEAVIITKNPFVNNNRYERKYKRSTKPLSQNIEILNPDTLTYLLYPKNDRAINIEIINRGESHQEEKEQNQPSYNNLENDELYENRNIEDDVVENRLKNHRVTVNDSEQLIKNTPSSQKSIASSINKILMLSEQDRIKNENFKTHIDLSTWHGQKSDRDITYNHQYMNISNKQRKHVLFPQIYYDPDESEDFQKYKNTIVINNPEKYRNVGHGRLIINNRKLIDQPLYKQIAIAFEMAKQKNKRKGNLVPKFQKDSGSLNDINQSLKSNLESLNENSNTNFNSYVQMSAEHRKSELDRENNFGKNVKLGNALEEIAVFNKQGGNKIRSFENGDDIVPYIDRYRSDLDGENPYDIPPSLLGVELRGYQDETQRNPMELTQDHVEYDQNRDNKNDSGLGLKLIKLSFEQCLLGKGSPLQIKDIALVSWTKTPMLLYGGARIKKAAPYCGRF